jgi:predicted RNase H-like HicB family nuclease
MGRADRLVVHATWDEEAHVWVATSDDVPGLATEAEDMEALVAKLKTMIPELLDANGVAHTAEVPFEILGRRFAVAHREVA